ncbi:MAG: hypothetical protein EPN30_04090 [Actinomycetota bacterium]|nr:MAG: hypothetical protein EPN30_04090 [Actinomycetota bacterium]
MLGNLTRTTNLSNANHSIRGIHRPRRVFNGRLARDEKGSSLVLALVFMIVTSLTVLSLAGLAKNDLNNTANFKSAQSLQSAANSAAELAVNSLRYNFMPQTLNASPPQPCWTINPSPSEITLNGQSMSVWCSTRWTPLSDKTRVVTFVACKSTTSALACAANPVLEAKVTFDDYPSPRGAISTAQCSTTCGVGMTVDSWVFDAVPPSVQSISPATGTTSGGTTITVTGTGFDNGAVVDFIDTDVNTNVILSAASVTVIDANTITAITPAMTAGTAYYVTVTTPTGTSAYGPVFN